MLSKITSWRHSKIIAFVLAVAVFLTAFYGLTPVISLAEATDVPAPQSETVVDIWDNSKPTFANAFAEQTEAGKGGSAENPYEITTGAQLYAATTCTEAVYFKLMNDIQLQSNDNMTHLENLIGGTDLPEGVTLYNWSKTRTRFIGTIDGNFHTVTGLYGSSSTVPVGFLSDVKGATIKNITFDKTYITGKKVMGGVVAWMYAGTTIDGCSVINSKLVNTCPVPAEDKTTDGQEAVGGIVGTAQYSSGISYITNCSVLNTELVQTDVPSTRLGGLWGDSWGSNTSTIAFSNCLVENYPVCQKSYVASYTNVFSTVSGSATAADGTTVTVIDAKYLKGAETPGIDASTGWEIKDADYPKYVGSNKHTEDSTVYWNGYTTTFDKAFAGQTGKGTDANTPYEIYYGYQLYAAVGCSDGSYFKLMNDIQLQSNDNMGVIEGLIANGGTNASLNSWRYTNTYSLLNLDGNNKTISGLYQNTTATGAYGLGLISVAKGGSSVSNLTLDTAYLTGKNKIGGIVGLPYQGSGGVRISGCNVKNSKFHNTSDSTDDQYNTIGGITAGHWSGGLVTIENCVVYDTQLISEVGQDNVGGLFGSETWTTGHTITNCISVGYIPHAAGSYAACTNTYTTLENYDAGVYGTLTEAQLKGAELPNINAKTGWEIKQGEYPKYTGKTSAHPVDTKVYWNGFIIRDNMNIPAANKTDAINSIVSAMEGSGESAEDPKLIYYGYQLYAAVNCTTDTYFKLMNDIQLQPDVNVNALNNLIETGEDDTNTSFNNWMTFNSGRRFIGEFDGNFKTVSKMYLSYAYSTEGTGSGLFGIIGQGAVVKNVTLDGAYIKGNGYTGGIVGYINASSADTRGNDYIAGCCVKNSRITSNYNTGGIVASGWRTLQTTIENCSSYDNIVECTGSQASGAIQANFWSNGSASQLKNSFSSNVFKTDGTTELSARGAGTGESTNVSQKMPSNKAKGAIAYDSMNLTPAKGWVVLGDNYPVYVGAGNAKNYNYDIPVWDGVKDVTYTDLAGTGVDGDAYLISTGAELWAAVNSETTDVYFEIINDIKLQSDAGSEHLKAVAEGKGEVALDTSKLSHTTSWEKPATFKSTLKGNKHTIYGLYTNSTSSGYFGLLSRIAGNATVEGIRLRGAYINSTNTGSDTVAAGIAGYLHGTGATVKIVDCDVQYAFIQAEDDVAGLIAASYQGDSCLFEKCVVANNHIHSTTSSKTPAGLFGSAWGANVHYTIKDSISVGYPAILNTSNNLTDSYVNTYTTSETSNDSATTGAPVIVTEEQLKGTVLPGIRPLTGWEIKADEYPVYTGVQGTEPTNSVTYWNGIRPTTLDEIEGNGTGIESDPYIIRHGFELYAAIQNTDSTKHFKLVNDIYLNDTSLSTSNWANYWAVWQQGKTFSGNIDGDGHTIYGLHEPSTSQTAYDTSNSSIGVGLFPAVGTATIKNLHLRNVNMPNCWHQSGNIGAGGLVGTAGMVTIEGCSVGGTIVTGYTKPAAGFVGVVNTSAEISNSVFIGGKISTTDKYKGVIGSIIGEAGTATVKLTDVIANGYAAIGNGTASEDSTNILVVGVDGGYATASELKDDLRGGNITLSDAFYYDYLSSNLPMLKNRLATQNVDIDGNEGAELDADDALALKNILLYGGANQVNATDKTNYYNEVEGLDITDLVYVYANAQ